MDNIILFSIGVVIAELIGGYLPVLRRWPDHYIHMLLGFSAGVLIGVSFLHLLPEAAESIGVKIGIITLLGYVSLMLMERFFLGVEDFGCHEEYSRKIGLVSFIGLSIHNLTDGFALITGLFSPKLGLLVALGVLVHKAPVAFSLATILVSGKYARKTVVQLITLFVLMTPLGTVLSLYFFKSLSHQGLGYVVAFTAGMFLYIATGHLLPSVYTFREHRGANFFAVLLGMGLTGLVLFLG